MLKNSVLGSGQMSGSKNELVSCDHPKRVSCPQIVISPRPKAVCAVGQLLFSALVNECFQSNTSSLVESTQWHKAVSEVVLNICYRANNHCVCLTPSPWLTFCLRIHFMDLFHESRTFFDFNYTFYVFSVCVNCYPLADIECAKSYAKMAESAKTLANQQVTKCETGSCKLFDCCRLYTFAATA